MISSSSKISIINLLSTNTHIEACGKSCMTNPICTKSGMRVVIRRLSTQCHWIFLIFGYHSLKFARTYVTQLKISSLFWEVESKKLLSATQQMDRAQLIKNLNKAPSLMRELTERKWWLWRWKVPNSNTAWNQSQSKIRVRWPPFIPSLVSIYRSQQAVYQDFRFLRPYRVSQPTLLSRHAASTYRWFIGCNHFPLVWLVIVGKQL